MVNQHAVSLLEIAAQLPASLDFRVTFNADPLKRSGWSNALTIFDYKGPDDYKFAGAFVGGDYWAIG